MLSDIQFKSYCMFAHVINILLECAVRAREKLVCKLSITTFLSIRRDVYK